MPDTIKIPGAGNVPKKYVYVGGIALAGLVGFAYWRNRHNASSATGATAASTDGTTSDTVDPNIDPQTGFDYGTPEDLAALNALNGGSVGAGLSDGTIDSTVPPVTSGGSGVDTGTSGGTGIGTPATPAQWAQDVEQVLPSIGYGPQAVATAVGRYLAKLPLDSNQQKLIRVALAEVGPVPGGSPPIIPRAGSAGGGSGPEPKFNGKREVANGTVSLNQWATGHHTTNGQVIDTTEDAFDRKILTPAHHAAFNKYLSTGSSQKMPKGLVFYSTK